MSDTQWPRYCVFKQDTAEDRHQSCGTVHAPDPVMALQIARDVFVRRPECYSLWVAPDEYVLSRSGEQWESASTELGKGEATKSFVVFVRPNHRDSHLYHGEILAASAEEAFERFYESEPELARLGTWVIPLEHIVKSQVDQEAAWFKPARSKPYRHGSFYHPEQLLRHLRIRKDQKDD